MTSMQLAEIIGDIGDELVNNDTKTRVPTRRPVRRISRVAAIAAAVIVLMIATVGAAEAAGVSIVKPFISWAGSALRLDYSASPYVEDDLPETTLDPSEQNTITHESGERYTFNTLEELKACMGDRIRLPGEEMGLEFVSAKCSISKDNALTIIHYLLGDDEIIIKARNTAVQFGDEYSAYTVMIERVLRSETRNVCGIDCECIYTTNRNYLSAIFENEAYLISGNVGIDKLEILFASMLGAA